MEWNNLNQINESFNERLIGFLKHELGKKKTNKAELCDEMGISQSVLYKRLSGISQFTLGELAFIMKKYNLSFDSWVWPNNDRVVMQVPGIQTPVASIEDFQRRLDFLFNRLLEGQNPTIQYATREIPVFYYFINARLGAFKMYFFSRFIWKIPGMAGNVPFSMDLVSKHITAEMKRLWGRYAQIPSVEVWNPNVWDNTLQQVLYLLELRDFQNPNDALEILKAIRQVIENCESIVSKGYKSFDFGQKGGSATFFNNRVTHTNNIILAKNSLEQMVFITHDNPNYMITASPEMIAYTQRWIDLLKEHARPLNSNNQEEFFRSLYHKVDLAVEKANGLLSRDSDWV